jgi:hypothetical protein
MGDSTERLAVETVDPRPRRGQSEHETFVGFDWTIAMLIQYYEWELPCLSSRVEEPW